jgi:FkbM family methyltransferase
MRKKIAFNVGASIGTSIDELSNYDIIYAFEPMPFSFKKLVEMTKDLDKVRCYQLAISNEDGYSNFNCHSHYEYSSLLTIKKDSQFFNKCSQIDPGFEHIEDIVVVETKRLDTFLLENKINHIDFLKIDTQGSDLSVVMSLGDSIQKVDLIELEVQNIPLYEDSPSKEETIEYLEIKGFELIDEVWNSDDVIGYEQRLTFKRNVGNFKKFPLINCLTLKDSKDRQNLITSTTHKYNLNVRFTDAYDGRKDDKYIPNVVGFGLDKMNKSEIMCSISHLKMIKEWLDSCEDEYGFFCEDDIDLTISDSWFFTWDNFIKLLPQGWRFVQLTLVKEFSNNTELKFTNYKWDSWSTCSYIMSRDYAINLINQHIKDGYYDLNLPYFPETIPYAENLIYNLENKENGYSFPLFIENMSVNSTFYPNFIADANKKINLDSSNFIKQWWLLNGYGKKIGYFFDKSLPVIGIPIVNGFHWLSRLIDSIDFPVKNLLIINNNGKGEIDDDLHKLCKLNHPFVDKIHILNMPSNLGVATSWNLIIKSFIMEPCWIISNNDIAFQPGLLRELFDKSNDSSIHMIHGSGGDFNDGSYDLFLIKESTIKKIGLFDENCYPAYCEDVDYIMRITRWNWDNPDDIIKVIPFLDTPYYHGDKLSSEDNYYDGGSQTKKQNTELNYKLDMINLINFDYMTQKWGPGWRMTDPYKYAMNIKEMPITYTSFDLEFVRKKYLGF